MNRILGTLFSLWIFTGFSQHLDSISMNGEKFRLVNAKQIYLNAVTFKLNNSNENSDDSHYICSANYELIDSLVHLKSVRVYAPIDTVLIFKEHEFSKYRGNFFLAMRRKMFQ
jgi:hypothetical protein